MPITSCRRPILLAALGLGVALLAACGGGAGPQACAGPADCADGDACTTEPATRPRA